MQGLGRLAVAGMAIFVVMCGAPYRAPFSYRSPDNREAELQQVLAKLRSGEAASRPFPLVVAATRSPPTADGPRGAGRRLVAFRLDSGARLWEVAFDAQSRPDVVGDVVLVSDGDQVVAFDAEDGSRLWVRGTEGLTYVGAARSADVVMLVATRGAQGGARAGRLWSVHARTGALLHMRRTAGLLGRPAISGEVALVPWEGHSLAALDVASATEITRIRSTDGMVAWVLASPAGVYFGDRRAYRLGPSSFRGRSEDLQGWNPALDDLPSPPERLAESAFLPRSGVATARDRIRFHFAPTEAGPVARGYYLAYYRYLFAYAADGQLRWARVLDEEVVNAQVHPRGLIIAGDGGHLRLLDARSGGDLWSMDLSLPVASIAIDAPDLRPTAVPAARSLRDALSEVVFDPDNRLLSARAYALTQLSRLPDPTITRDLLRLVDDPNVPAGLKSRVRAVLPKRTTGRAFVLEALARRYDFLAGDKPPPLDVVLPALVTQREEAALEHLVAHMQHHATPAFTLPALVRGVAELGGASALPALRSFLVRHRAASAFGSQRGSESPEGQALAEAARGIFVYGGVEGRRRLRALAKDGSFTHPELVASIRKLFTDEREAAARAEADRERSARQALSRVAQAATARLPGRLSDVALRRAFRQRLPAFRTCLRRGWAVGAHPPAGMRLRLAFTLENDGRIDRLRVSPSRPGVEACMAKQLAHAPLPRFSERRMAAAITLRVRPAEVEPAGDALSLEDAEAAPWWAWFRMAERGLAQRPVSALHETIPDGPAWWAPRDPTVRPRPGRANTSAAPVRGEAGAEAGRAQAQAPWWAGAVAPDASKPPNPHTPPARSDPGEPRGATPVRVRATRP